jgi:hypothetical protein
MYSKKQKERHIAYEYRKEFDIMLGDMLTTNKVQEIHNGLRHYDFLENKVVKKFV